jgi:hypothetical protein
MVYDLEPPSRRLRGQHAAISTIPGVLFSAGWGGVLRALSTSEFTFDFGAEFLHC